MAVFPNLISASYDLTFSGIVIYPALICTKSLINTIAQHKPQKVSDLDSIEDMKNWQRKEFGRDIVKLMQNLR